LSGKQLSLGFNSVENSVAQLVEACDREAKAIDIRLTSLTLDLQVANGLADNLACCGVFSRI
jgi:hypothetical protein